MGFFSAPRGPDFGRGPATQERLSGKHDLRRLLEKVPDPLRLGRRPDQIATRSQRSSSGR